MDRLAKRIPETSNPAWLLSDVVDDSVKRWEFDRAKGVVLGMDTEMRPEMLTAGFSAIGHLLDATPSAHVSDVDVAIAEALEGWNLSPSLTTVIAQQVRAFWDESVGVFVETDGLVSARSRLFSELGDARFALGLTAERRNAWIRSALTSDDKRMAVMIAGLRDACVYDDLLQTANKTPPDAESLRAATWLADEAFDISMMTPEQVESVLTLFSGLSEQGVAPLANTGYAVFGRRLASAKEGAGSVDPPGYAFALALARTDIPANLERKRRSALDSLGFPEPHASVLASRVELAPSGTAPAVLSEETLGRIRTALGSAPEVDREPLGRDSSGAFVVNPGPHMIPGLSEVAALAIGYLDQLGPEAPNQVFTVSRQSTVRQAGNIRSKMARRGFKDPEPLAIFDSFATLFEGFEDHSGWGFFLRAWAGQLDCAVQGGSNESWRLKSIGDLVQALEWGEVGIAEFRAACEESSEVLLAWSDAYARALNIDRSLVAEQASSILLGPGGPRYPVDAMLAFAFEREDAEPDFTVSSAMDLEALVPALASSSPWISRTTLGFFVQDPFPEVSEMIAAIEGPRPRETMRNMTIAYLFNCSERASETRRLVEADGLSSRVAAAEFTRWMNDSELLPVRNLALSSPDGTVRARAGADLDQALAGQYWSCWYCGYRNEPPATSCRAEECGVTRGSSWGEEEK